MPKFRLTTELIQTPKRREVCLVQIDGIISTPTIELFKESIQEPISHGRDILLDFEKITYINSSGLGELVRIHDIQEQKSLSLILIRINDEVRRLISMLGLTNILYLCDTLEEAQEHLDRGQESLRALHEAEEETVVQASAFIPRSSGPHAPLLPSSRVMLALPREDAFSRFLARYLSGKSGAIELVHSLDKAKAVLEAGVVNIAILDNTLADAHAICAQMKTTHENGISSVIMIYPDEEASLKHSHYRICEDEFVVEPFDVREILTLAESEVSRCQSESILFEQEIHIEIATRDQAIARANKTLEELLGNSALESEKRDSFFYAIREAIDNARRHGNQHEEDKLIDILYVLDKEKITVTIQDEGDGFDYNGMIRRATSLSPLEQARSRHAKGEYGGLGIGLMLRCCDRVDYMPPGNIVRITKYH